MKGSIANYTVVIEKQQRIGTQKSCYVGYIPILGIATEADTIEKLQEELSSLIQFHIECLVEEGEEIPLKSNDSLVARLEAVIPIHAKTVLS